MEFGKVIISPDLDQLFLIPEGDGNPHAVLQQTFLRSKPAHMIEIDQNATAHQEKIVPVRKWGGKGDKGFRYRIFQSGLTHNDGGVALGTQHTNITAEKMYLYAAGKKRKRIFLLWQSLQNIVETFYEIILQDGF